MTVYAMSGIRSVSVSTGHGGCGVPHLRPVDENGYGVQPWALTCPGGCEEHLRGLGADQWATAVEDIVPTFDERKATDKWALTGAREQQAFLTILAAQAAGFGDHQLPESLQQMKSKLRPGLTVAGHVVCPACQHSQPPSGKFCMNCAAPMTTPVAAAAITAGPASS